MTTKDEVIEILINMLCDEVVEAEKTGMKFPPKVVKECVGIIDMLNKQNFELRKKLHERTE